jgi:hypothetical protein
LPTTIVSFSIHPEDKVKHLGLWHVKTKPSPKIHSPPEDFFTDYPDSQISPWDDDYSDPDYPFEAYM